MDKNLSLKQCLKWLWKFIRPNQKKFWIGVAFAVILQVVYVLMPFVESQITNQLQLDLSAMQAHKPGAHIQMTVIVNIMGALCALYCIKLICQFIMTFALTDAIQKTVYDLREAIEHKINMLPVSYFDHHAAGDLLSRITNDTETVSNALQQTLSRIIGTICTLLFCLSMMLYLSPMMTLFVCIGLPVIALISFSIMKKAQPAFDRQQEVLANLNSVINEQYSGYSEIISNNHQKKSAQLFDQVNFQMYEASFKASFLSNTIQPACSLITYCTIGICALYGCLQVLGGVMLLGTLQAFIRYIWNVSDPITQLSQLSSAIQSAFSGMNRLFTFLSLEPEEDSPDQNSLKRVSSVKFDHVRFSYNDQKLIEDLSFEAKEKQTIAIVGPTGAGKTTLTNLLLRFYEIKDGAITINGQDIRTLSRNDLRDLYGLVLQDPWLFAGSIRENLCYGNLEADERQIEEAIKTTGLKEIIEKIPDGLEGQISSGAENLSQGEKQLITIARALLKDPAVLILDEATSSVDTRMEKKLQQAMDALMKDRTCFVIAHRLSTILDADQILVVNDGAIVEQGTHQQLMEKEGFYFRLYQSQFSSV